MKTIITIGRQFGSGGKEIGIRVAKELGIPFYDKELLQEAAKKSGLCEKIFENFDERPKSLLYSIAMDSYMFALPGSGVGDSLEQQVYLATSTPSGTSRTKGLRYHRPVRGLRPGGLSQPPEPVYQRTSGGPYPARGPAAEPHAGEGSPADPQDRQAPGVLLRVLFLQEVGQCGQLPLLHRFQLSGPGPDRGADPGMVAHKEHPIPSPTEEDPTRPRT